jgi:acetyl-CoA carboxylase carboxyl transferase subunit beta
VVHRHQLKETITRLCSLLTQAPQAAAPAAPSEAA